MLGFRATCSCCGEQFVVDTFNTHKRNAKVIAHENKSQIGQSITLIYYDCPVCGHRHFVQADNENTTAVLMRSEALFIKAVKSAKAGKKLHQKQLDKRKQAEMDLTRLRKELQEQLEGCTVAFCGGEEQWKVHFHTIASK